MDKSLSGRFNTAGPKPGSLKAISQHKAIAEGYEAAPTKDIVKADLHGSTTGTSHVPGLTNRGKKMGAKG